VAGGNWGPKNCEVHPWAGYKVHLCIFCVLRCAHCTRASASNNIFLWYWRWDAYTGRHMHALVNKTIMLSNTCINVLRFVALNVVQSCIVCVAHRTCTFACEP